MFDRKIYILRQSGLLCLYAVSLSFSLWLSYELRFDFSPAPLYLESFFEIALFIVGLKIFLLLILGQFGSLLSYFGVRDIEKIFAVVFCTAVAALGIWFLGGVRLAPPRAVILTDLLISFLVLCGIRMGFRLLREGYFVGAEPIGRIQKRMAIVGAGDVGATLVKDFLMRRGLGVKPIVFFDDDPKKWGTTIHGISVAGAPEFIPNYLTDRGLFDEAVIAMPSVAGKRLKEIVSLLAASGIKFQIVPSIEQLVTGKVRISQTRPVEIQDLLGRNPVIIETERISRLVQGCVVMVTGAGGSIGGELCRQIAGFNPSRLLMVDQSEPSLFLIEQEMIDSGAGATAHPLVANIGDEARMNYIFALYKPSIVFHAAAHKHVYLMERQPAEAIRNNSIGTRLLAQMAASHGVSTFVLISTDKAINPTSLMGASKRLAEIYLQALHATGSLTTKFVMVRFGNVLGSSGSVIPIFKKQIAAGGPVTVTHPDVTRYFMTIPESVGLVMQATVLGNGGEIFVLDMGQPVKISDLARQMIELSGHQVGEDIEIKYTGLKPGEKLFEELQHKNERFSPTAHPRIMRFIPSDDATVASALSIKEIETRLYSISSGELKLLLAKVVPEYIPFVDEFK